jgi:hypothetical protein
MPQPPAFSWPDKDQFLAPPRDRRTGRKVAVPLKQDQRKPERKFDMTIVRTPKKAGQAMASFSEEEIRQASSQAAASTIVLPPSPVPRDLHPDAVIAGMGDETLSAATTTPASRKR